MQTNEHVKLFFSPSHGCRRSSIHSNHSIPLHNVHHHIPETHKISNNLPNLISSLQASIHSSDASRSHSARNLRPLLEDHSTFCEGSDAISSRRKRGCKISSIRSIAASTAKIDSATRQCTLISLLFISTLRYQPRRNFYCIFSASNSLITICNI